VLAEGRDGRLRFTFRDALAIRGKDTASHGSLASSPRLVGHGGLDAERGRLGGDLRRGDVDPPWFEMDRTSDQKPQMAVYSRA